MPHDRQPVVRYHGEVLRESAADGAPRRAGGQAFWWRLSDNLFRRLFWFALPVIALTVLGVAQARDTLALYRSTGTLSASTNPLVPQQPISGASAQFYESPGGATSRIINERLQTDRFLRAVADQAGLTSAIESGLIELDIVRESIWASANGDSILSVNAQWADPSVSYNLAAATIDQYETFLTETVASDSNAAEDFYTTQLEALNEEHEAAQAALDTYVRSLPDPEPGSSSYPINVQLEVERLNDKISSMEERIDAAQENVNAAKLARTQQTSEVGRSFDVIDAPRVPSAPESTLMAEAMLIASFLVLGLVIAAAALLVTTMLDQTVASAADLLSITGITTVATVPPARTLLKHRARWRPGRRRSRIRMTEAS